MNTKKSLGHFPFGSTPSKKSKLSFIPDINGSGDNTDSNAASPFDETEEDIKKRESNLKAIETENELMERKLPPEENQKPSKKKVASYYLEESIVNRLKAFADPEKASYSSVVTDAIEIYVGKRGF